jgi:predicted negative regulator of RcsB-dependent stress response
MAQRHPSSKRRPDPRRGDEAEDVFVAKVFEASRWADKNRVTLIAAIVLVVVGGFGIKSWMDYRERLHEQAVLQLEEIQQSIALGDPETAKAELSQYLSRFGSTPYAGEARLLLAELYLESDQAPQAVETLEASDIPPAEPMGVQIETLKAKAYEAAGRLDEAEGTFLRVADRAELQFQAVEALADAARIREAKGDWAGAIEIYERILEDLEESDADAGLYELRLAEARTAAESGGGGSAD